MIYTSYTLFTAPARYMYDECVNMVLNCEKYMLHTEILHKSKVGTGIQFVAINIIKNDYASVHPLCAILV